jgi:hypothetical protein
MRTAAIRHLAIVVIAASMGAGSARANPDGRHPSSGPSVSHDDLDYILMFDDNRMNMSGSTEDIHKVVKLRHGKDPILWFRQAGREYLVRDPATIHQAVALWKPVTELGEQQGELGRQQGELGRRQGQIGMRQGQLGARQGELATREATIDLRADSDSLTPAERAQLKTELRDIHKQMRALERDMRSAEAPMRDLGAQMEVLGHQMEALGNKLEAASRKATAELRVLAGRAIASGAASPL